MSTRSLLVSLFQYKASADRELLDGLSPYADDEAADRFRSALRVLHHAHIVDRIFAANLERRRHDFKESWANDTPPLTDLMAAVADTDQWFIDYVSQINSSELEELVDFTFTDRRRGRMSREEMLAHVVTHGGYHRGEAGRLLPEIGYVAMRDLFAGYLHRAEPQRRH